MACHRSVTASPDPTSLASAENRWICGGGPNRNLPQPSRVIVAGLGRVGQVVARLLNAAASAIGKARRRCMVLVQRSQDGAPSLLVLGGWAGSYGARRNAHTCAQIEQAAAMLER